MVGGTTPAGGGTAVVGGTTVSLAPSATQAVVGGTSTEGLAPYIVGGLGMGPNGTGTGTGTGTGVVQFVGGAVAGKSKCWDLRYLCALTAGVVLVF